jgi:formylglycine-generating enzyme required for sulfatase activity
MESATGKIRGRIGFVGQTAGRLSVSAFVLLCSVSALLMAILSTLVFFGTFIIVLSTILPTFDQSNVLRWVAWGIGLISWSIGLVFPIVLLMNRRSKYAIAHLTLADENIVSKADFGVESLEASYNNANHQNRDLVGKAKGEIDTYFATENGPVVVLTDGFALGPTRSGYTFFHSLTDYRRFAGDNRNWREISPSEGLASLPAAAVAILISSDFHFSLDANSSRKSRIFISYSRKDLEFAGRLEAAMRARGFEILIDREEIYAFEDWWGRIQALIGRADTIVFVLSPDSVKSGIALKEVSYAASLRKRFAPIVYRKIDDETVPEPLRRINFVFFDDLERFEASADQLAEALKSDIGWVRQHTEYGEAERRWADAGRPNSLLLRSPSLEAAEYWLASRPGAAPEPTKEIRAFIAASREATHSARQLRRITAASFCTLFALIVFGVVGWVNQSYLADQWRWWNVIRQYAAAQVWPYVLNAAQEQTLKPGNTFRECRENCPEMVVIPAGSYTMGLFETQRHTVTIAKPFAVSKYEVTFADWGACVDSGGCNGYRPSDMGWRGDKQPVINVDWGDAQAYVAWLSRVTGKTYRLLSEAEYEYATRAGTTTAYPWGDDIKLNGQPMANCKGCGSRYDNSQTAPVGSFPPNKFGLHDMVGNVWEWTEDCYHTNYQGAPADGSSWAGEADCTSRVVRAASCVNSPEFLQSGYRNKSAINVRSAYIGFRIARTLAAGPAAITATPNR